MIKLLLLALMGFIAYSLISVLLTPLRQVKKTPQPNRSQSGEQMVECPQCGTYLPVSDAIETTVQGKTACFCSQKCLNEYKNAKKS